MTPEARSYLRGLKSVERRALSCKAGISLKWLYNITYNEKQKPSPVTAVALERASGGRVTRESLRPDLDWSLLNSLAFPLLRTKRA